MLDDLLGQAELGDAVHQHAAGGVEGLEDGDLVAQLAQVGRAGQPGRAGAHHRHLDAVGRRLFRLRMHVVPVPVGHEPLQSADGHRLPLLAPDAQALALALLGADPAGHGGQTVGLMDDLIGRLEVPLRHLGDEFGDLDVHRAARHTGRLFALEAAPCFLHRHLGGIAQVDLFKIVIAHVGVLLGDRYLGRAQVRHVLTPLPSTAGDGTDGSASSLPPAPGRPRCG